MITSVLLLEASTLLFAFGTSYWVLLIARFLQGIKILHKGLLTLTGASSGAMWTASMALVAGLE